MPHPTVVPAPPSSSPTPAPETTVVVEPEAGRHRRRTIDLRTPSAESAPEWSRLLVLSLIVALNIADVLTTKAIAGRELNPVAGWLLERGGLEWAKLAILAAVVVLGIRVPRRPWVGPALWLVAGAYSLVVAVNLSQLLSR